MTFTLPASQVCTDYIRCTCESRFSCAGYLPLQYSIDKPIKTDDKGGGMLIKTNSYRFIFLTGVSSCMYVHLEDTRFLIQ